jgi:hypothetical protein
MVKKLALFVTFFMFLPFVSLASDYTTNGASGLVGDWVCTKYRVVSPVEVEHHPPYYQESTNKLFVYLDNLNLNITKDPDGTVKWSSSPRNAFAGIYSVMDWNNQPTGRYSDECLASGVMESFKGAYATTSPNCLGDLSGWGPLIDTLTLTIERINFRTITIQSSSATPLSKLSCTLQPRKKGRWYK